MKNNIVRIFSLLVLALPMMVLAQEGQEGQKSQEDVAVDELALGDSASGDSAIENEAKQQDQQQETSEKNIKSAPQDGDFKPSEEISEDFPVPLPSDI
tara:strand:- start:2320 stop:2613 length:294 start_codon:yes stop_codon:yes gene_type:complete